MRKVHQEIDFLMLPVQPLQKDYINQAGLLLDICLKINEEYLLMWATG